MIPPPGGPADVVGVLLAGGLSRRMGGGDKTLGLLGGRSILSRAVDRLGPQVAALVINANGDPARFAAFGLPVAADVVDGYAGPLAGVLTGMEWGRAHAPGCAWIVPTLGGMARPGDAQLDEVSAAEAAPVVKALEAAHRQAWLAPSRADFERLGLVHFPILMKFDAEGRLAELRMGDAAPEEPGF